MTRLRADALLLLCALIWGSAFVAQKDSHIAAWPALFVCARFSISALLLAPLAWIETRRHTARPAPRDLALAVLIGACLCLGATMQQSALAGTTATNGGFLTAVYVAIVPFAVWLIVGTPPRRILLGACAITVFGAWLLASNGHLAAFAHGDLILLLSDLVWAVHITLIGIFLIRAGRPFLLCFMQYACTAIGAGLYSAATESAAPAAILQALPAVLYAGIASGGIAYTLQIVAQRHTPPAEAALILCLESVFAAITGALFLHERLSLIGIGGCLLILAGAGLVELLPLIQARRSRGSSGVAPERARVP